MVDQLQFRKWQEEQSQEQQRFQAEQRANDLARQDAQRVADLERDRKNKRRDRIWAVALIVLAAAVGVCFDPLKVWVHKILGIP